MNKEEAIKIMNKEGLEGYNFFEDRLNKENEVVITTNNNQWSVFVTDERASKIINSEDIYVSESEALEDFIERLRADKILRELWFQINSLVNTTPKY